MKSHLTGSLCGVTGCRCDRVSLNYIVVSLTQGIAHHSFTMFVPLTNII